MTQTSPVLQKLEQEYQQWIHKVEQRVAPGQRHIIPQARQYQFLRMTWVDIVIYGGAAGGG